MRIALDNLYSYSIFGRIYARFTVFVVREPLPSKPLLTRPTKGGSVENCIKIEDFGRHSLSGIKDT